MHKVLGPGVRRQVRGRRVFSQIKTDLSKVLQTPAENGQLSAKGNGAIMASSKLFMVMGKVVNL